MVWASGLGLVSPLCAPQWFGLRVWAWSPLCALYWDISRRVGKTLSQEIISRRCVPHGGLGFGFGLGLPVGRFIWTPPAVPAKQCPRKSDYVSTDCVRQGWRGGHPMTSGLGLVWVSSRAMYPTDCGQQRWHAMVLQSLSETTTMADTQ
jgi:hypothetical protein